jgi:hypothetical protein
MAEDIHKGSCLCGAVTYTLTGPLRPSVACHCGQCRKTSGHYWSATQVPTEKLTISGENRLKWYRSSDHAQRGFCTECGSSLFWTLDGEDATSVASGTLDGPTGMRQEKHIFVKDKGDYYDIDDGLPKIESY